MPKRQFLNAKWSNLLMINYEVDPAILEPHLPPGTQLDTWEGKTLVSVVGFLFQETRMLGIKWPFHVNFEEVNLRFYVKYLTNEGEMKRGAVFISEIVPKFMIAIIANTFYNEHYMALPMRHSINPVGANDTHFLYEWKYKGKWNKLSGTVNNERQPIAPGSAEEFILEHYWGYNKLSESKMMEYAVEHITWQTGEVKDFVLDADITGLYGEAFAPWLSKPPQSVYFADGSDVVVRVGSVWRSRGY